MDKPPCARMPFVDNLRLALIILVVCVHAAITYSGLGSWYHKEGLVLDPASRLFFSCFQGFSQAFFMGALFALAGYFAAQALKKKGPRAFALGRAWRLGLPALLYMLAVNPLLVYWLVNPGGLRQETGFFGYLGWYLSSGKVLAGSGPMWFAVALLAFCLVYAAGMAVWRGGGPGEASRGAARPLTGGLVLALVLACALGSYAVRMVQPVGTNILNMQLGFFTQYVVLFAFGIAAHGRDWLRTIPAGLGRPCLALSLAGLPVLAALLYWGGGLGPGLEDFFGRGHWKSLAFALWESAVGVGMTVGLVWLGRERWNSQGSLARALTDGAFAVYVFHPPVLVGLALLLAPLPLAAVPKFLVLSATALPVCFGLARVLRRVPVLRDLLNP